MSSGNRIYLFDSTLRDGAQTHGVDFTVPDKVAIALALDRLGIDYVEGGWPGANPTDDEFFADPPKLDHAAFTAFGMTRRPGRSVDNDPGLAALLNVRVDAVCIVGKTWDFHVDTALEIEPTENIDMIAESIAHIVARDREALFDAEHFFDGYKANPEFALDCVTAAHAAGARWVVLCDTNGGTMPDEVERITAEVAGHIPGTHLGIHCHNDTENAVANSLAAVRAGARQVQGSLNGLGERCGNANLISVIPNLVLKMGYETAIAADGLAQLTRVSRLLDDRLNRQPSQNAAYVGSSAFAHKGGLHVSAVEKDPATYEHVEPALIGNERHIVVSDQSGRSNILARFRKIGIEIDDQHAKVPQLLEDVKRREFKGYTYDSAEASFELLARGALGEVPEYFRLESFRVIDERKWNARGEPITVSEATVKLDIANERHMAIAEGNGPVNALDNALREVLQPIYPELGDVRLMDYKVRILTPNAGTGAMTRVMIESGDGRDGGWTTIGVSTNVIDASYRALRDSITYKLYRDGARAA